MIHDLCANETCTGWILRELFCSGKIGKSGIMNAGKKVLHGEITCKTFFNKIILQLVRN